MLTPQDVHSVQFEKSFRGYKIEDVDRFLDRVEEQLRTSADENQRLRQQLEQLQGENQRLSKETEDFRADGEIMKSALINAQRIGENVIREANQKAEEIIHKANLRADDIIRDANDLLQKATERADEIVREANDQRLLEERGRLELPGSSSKTGIFFRMVNTENGWLINLVNYNKHPRTIRLRGDGSFYDLIAGKPFQTQMELPPLKPLFLRFHTANKP